jgi:L-seryl-tRNA(Ser) seleniumtransferase
MDDMSDYYVNMDELIDAVGKRISDMLGVEATLVTSGCAAALAVGAAACMTGEDIDKIEQLPDTTGMKNEILIQKQLRLRYDRSMSIPGSKIVEVGGIEETRPEQLEDAINEKTAAIHFWAPGNRPGALPLKDVIRIGHAHDVPIIVDAAGEVYPTDLLSKYVKMGADLVAYGAKYFGSVNSSGMLTGRADLVKAAKMNSFIGFESISRDSARAFGRPMKMDRQEVVAVYAALREWLTMNHEDRLAAYDVRVSAMRSDLRGVSGITMADYPANGPMEGLKITVDAQKVGKTGAEVIEELRNGNPSIWVRELDDDSLVVRMTTLKEGGEKVIADRLKEIL